MVIAVHYFLPLDQKDSKTHHHYPTHQAAHTQLIVRHRVVKKTNRGSKNRVVIVQEICVLFVFVCCKKNEERWGEEE